MVKEVITLLHTLIITDNIEEWITELQSTGVKFEIKKYNSDCCEMRCAFGVITLWKEIQNRARCKYFYNIVFDKNISEEKEMDIKRRYCRFNFIYTDRYTNVESN